MANMVELHNRWRGFAAERAKARREVDNEVDANNAEIERLRLKNIDLNKDFQEKWAREKRELQEERDRAVMDAMAEGKSGQEILRALGSRNTVWIYDLRKRLAAEGRLPETLNENSNPVPQERLTAKKLADQQMDASDYDHVSWHAGTGPELSGWYISDDWQLVKRERRGGRWFIAGPNNEFLKGDKGFYQITGEEAIGQNATRLMDLLEPADNAEA